MYDVIGKRKWFYLISAAVTIPGLIFILLTFIPGSKLGLQFSIAYTGVPFPFRGGDGRVALIIEPTWFEHRTLPLHEAPRS